MDPATLFLLHLVGVLSLWLLGTAVRPAFALASRVSVALPFGRRFAAVMISVILVGGAAAARASVEPPSHRMVRMVDTAPSIVHRPLVATVRSTYTVVKGDSLWKIARSVLAVDASGEDISSLWRAIYDVNRQLIGSDPNLIHPGQVLHIPGR